MLLTEFDEESFAEAMREEGREEGIEKGEERLNHLYLKLVTENKTSDLERAMRDKDFRNTLFKRYDL